METAEGWYGKARKQRRAGKSLEPLIQSTQDDLTYLQEVQASLEQLQGQGEAGVNPDLAALQGIQVGTGVAISRQVLQVLGNQATSKEKHRSFHQEFVNGSVKHLLNLQQPRGRTI